MDDIDFTISDHEIAAGYDRMKRDHGTVVMTVFIASGIYHHAAFGGFRSLFGIGSIAFFVVGMFLAPLTIGVATYLLQRLIGKIAKVSFDPFKASTATALQALAVGLFAIQIVATWLATRWVYLWLHASGT